MMKFVKPSKFCNKKIVTSEGVFDSKLEYNRWLFLSQLEKEGKIENLQRQVKFLLIPTQRVLQKRFNKKGKELKPKEIVAELECAYYADFVYEVPSFDSAPEGCRWTTKVVEDTKSKITKTPEYRIKKKLMRYLLQIPITEITKATQLPPCLI